LPLDQLVVNPLQGFAVFDHHEREAESAELIAIHRRGDPLNPRPVPGELEQVLAE
jgi:hypothetical protein